MDQDTGFDALHPRDYLMDRESDLLADLPDFHKMKLADVDVIERSAAKCQPRVPTEVKVYKWKDPNAEKETDPCGEESEELEIHNLIEEGASTNEEAPEIRIIMGLDQLLKRIEIMQCDIRLRQQLEGTIESQTEDQATMQQEQADMDKCHGFPRHLAEIRQLQRAQNQLQCQVTELLCRYANLRTQKRSLAHQWNLVLQKTAKIREFSREYQRWMQDTSQEISLCRKRSREIQSRKLTKHRANEVTETNIWSSFRYSQRYLLRKLVTRHMKDLRDEIQDLRRYSEELTTEIDKRVVWITKKATKLGRLSRISDEPLANDVSIDMIPSLIKLGSKHKGRRTSKKTQS